VDENPSARPLVILPTFNEAESLPELLAQVFAVGDGLHVLVVDDASPDGTAALVRSHREFGERLHLVERSGKQGLGSAYRAGFAWAMERTYTAVLEMDADLSHAPADLPRLLAELDKGADLAVGSRYLNGISVVHWPLRRLLLSMGAGIYSRVLTGLTLSDPTSGFKAVRRAALEQLLQCDITAEGYGFQIELHYRAQHAGLRLREVPIVFTERRDGQSKMSGAIAYEAIWLVLRLAMDRIGRWFK
jgi:dolichol-phosphate mannosyltransferase